MTQRAVMAPSVNRRVRWGFRRMKWLVHLLPPPPAPSTSEHVRRGAKRSRVVRKRSSRSRTGAPVPRRGGARAGGGTGTSWGGRHRGSSRASAPPGVAQQGRAAGRDGGRAVGAALPGDVAGGVLARNLYAKAVPAGRATSSFQVGEAAGSSASASAGFQPPSAGWPPVTWIRSPRPWRRRRGTRLRSRHRAGARCSWSPRCAGRGRCRHRGSR